MGKPGHTIGKMHKSKIFIRVVQLNFTKQTGRQ